MPNNGCPVNIVNRLRTLWREAQAAAESGDPESIAAVQQRLAGLIAESPNPECDWVDQKARAIIIWLDSAHSVAIHTALVELTDRMEALGTAMAASSAGAKKKKKKKRAKRGG